MFDALAAERLKLARHRAAWWLVWVFPIGFTALIVLVTAWQMVRGQPAPEVGPPETAAGWIGDSLAPWIAASSTFGRYLLAGFTAVAFGGEYGWNTWKLIAPHRGRTSLLGAKYLTVAWMIGLSLVLTAVLTTPGLLLHAALTNDPVPRGIAAEAVLAENGRAGSAAFLAVILTVAYAAAGSVLTRSTLAGAIIGIVAVTAEALALNFASMLQPLLLQALPSYHLGNLRSWITDGEALSLRHPAGPIALGWSVSLAAYLAWVAGLVGVTVSAFRRQDLN
jgi:hypothetical protein